MQVWINMARSLEGRLPTFDSQTPVIIFRLSLAQIVCNKSKMFPHPNVYILPPAEEANETDIDSDASDDKHTDDVNLLPHKIRGQFELVPLDNDDEYDPDHCGI